MSPTSESAIDQTVRDQAIAWLVRVQSDQATDEDWRGLTEWLEASAAHQNAFDEIERLASDIDEQADAISRGIRPDTAAILPFRRKGPGRFVVGSAIAAAAAVLVAAPLLTQSYLGTAITYQTGIGETRDISLGDGSRIRLDAASRITVRLGWRARHVTMSDAEASFDVAKDLKRPFLIDVGDQQVRVVGTEFNIRHYDRRMTLTVRRGVVEVRQPSLGDTPLARLTIGDSLKHTEGATGSTQARTDPDAAFAWARGELVGDDEPLMEITAYLNRRYPVPIRVAPSAAGRRFTGVLELGDQSVLVNRLAQYLAVSVDRTDKEITLR